MFHLYFSLREGDLIIFVIGYEPVNHLKLFLWGSVYCWFLSWIWVLLWGLWRSCLSFWRAWASFHDISPASRALVVERKPHWIFFFHKIFKYAGWAKDAFVPGIVSLVFVLHELYSAIISSFNCSFDNEFRSCLHQNIFTAKTQKVTDKSSLIARAW